MVVHARYPRAETRVERQAHAAREAGFEVDVVCVGGPEEPARECGDDGVRIFRLPVGRTRGASALTAVREYLGFTLLASRRVAGLHRQSRYGVIQIHNPPDFLVLAGLVPRLRGARLVLDIHDFAPELFALRFAGRRWSRSAERLLWRIERLATRMVDAVVTVHEPYRRLLVDRGVPPERITVVLNSPEERLLPSPHPADVSEGARIVYHGTLTEHYGLATLIDAAPRILDRLPQACIEIYGEGDALEQLRAQARRLGVEERVRFSGEFLPNDEVLQRVRGASVGVVANLAVARNQAAVPTKLFEYAAMEIPVACSDLQAVHEYFDDSELAFFPAGDPDALADAVIRLVEDADAAAAQAARARGRYESYRWGVAARGYVALLDSLVV
ncbi:MAG: glycosyltransferase family 4 protein [Gaiellaceae bacterium]